MENINNIKQKQYIYTETQIQEIIKHLNNITISGTNNILSMAMVIQNLNEGKVEGIDIKDAGIENKKELKSK